MAILSSKGVYARPNIIESEVGLVCKTRTGTDDMAVTVNGRSIIKAGTYWEVEDSDEAVVERGVVLQDYDLTGEETYPISVVFQGRLHYDLCDDDAQAAYDLLALQGLILVGAPAAPAFPEPEEPEDGGGGAVS